MTSSLLAQQVIGGDKIRRGAHRWLLEANAMEGMARRTPRYFGDGKGRVLSEEGRAAENVYIQKMERERMEKLRRKAEKERLEAEKAESEKADAAGVLPLNAVWKHHSFV
ncbi:hypothetical protein B296_00012829 [Ensete ventricosum]|uniref:Uncharacterized protein n=1 Tax=Ensete ventricosum TaxID=4639 RepID=A0A427AYW8_ENSVE|nr:hypothetical protein B296_00012829 [Ensete ventricosum]